VVPVKGRGKGAAHRIMSGLDLDEPGLEVIRIKESKLENRGSIPLYFQGHPKNKVPGVAIKQKEECPYGPLDLAIRLLADDPTMDDEGLSRLPSRLSSESSMPVWLGPNTSASMIPSMPSNS